MSRQAALIFVSALWGISSVPAWAHHSFGEYDWNHAIELEGTLLEVRWQNPHVHITLQTTDTNGRTRVWDLETNSLSVLRRTNATPENLKVGQLVRVWGAPSRRSADRMFVANILQSNGRELVLDFREKPRWRKTAVGSETTWLGGAVPASGVVTIFHVWASDLSDFSSVPWKNPSEYPLTERARAALSKWDRIHDTVAHGCEPKGMPTIIEQPYPIEFVDKHETILMRMEEYDTVRSIHMTASAAPSSQPKTPLGYSTGHWEGRTLVVNTSRIDWPYFDSNGIPQGRDMSIVERFTPSADGSQLNYTMTVTDAEIFTEPVELRRAWVRRPGEEVKPYNCQVERTGAPQ